jgi:hypothetical protein
MTSPRPILKGHHRSYPSSSLSSPPHNQVHFPPSPSISRIYSAHSASAYDRSPIIVAPNSCALPERGCPGRTYTLDDTSPTRPTSWRQHAPSSNGKHLHPRAVNFSDVAVPRAMPPMSPPPLIPDLSSESDESDEHTLYPLRHRSYPPQQYTSFGPLPNIHHAGGVSPPTALTYLPFSPSSHEQYDQMYPPPPPLHEEKQKRHRDHSLRRDRSHERDSLRLTKSGLRGGAQEQEEEDEEGEEVDLPGIRRCTAKNTKRSSGALGLCKPMSSLGFSDDVGCLGGF